MSDELREDELGQVREIRSFDELMPSDFQTKRGFQDKITGLAKGAGLNDMHDVVTYVLELGKFTQLHEISDDSGGVAFLPQLDIDVDLKNAPEILKMLSASLVICLALATNEHFKVHWDSQYQSEGMFGETWQNGYYHFERGSTSPMVYLDLLEVYTEQMNNVQKWYMAQIDQLPGLIDSLGDKLGNEGE